MILIISNPSEVAKNRREMAESIASKNGRLDLHELHDLFLYYCHRRRDSHIEARLTDNITSGKLRQQYGRKHDSMALQPFLKFVNEAPGLLHPQDFGHQQAKLIFSQCLGYTKEHKWELKFSQFLDALLSIAHKRYPPDSGADVDAFRNLVEASIFPLYIRLFGQPTNFEEIDANEEEETTSVSTKKFKRPSLLVQTPLGVMPQHMAENRGLTAVDARQATGRRSSRLSSPSSLGGSHQDLLQGQRSKSSLFTLNLAEDTNSHSQRNMVVDVPNPPPRPPGGTNGGDTSMYPTNGGYGLRRITEDNDTSSSEEDATAEPAVRARRINQEARNSVHQQVETGEPPSREKLVELLQSFVQITGALIEENKVG